jgi:inhibitor of KinA
LNSTIHIYNLGDAAATVELGSTITPALNQQAIALRQHLIDNPFIGLKEVVLSYSSVTVYYDPFIVRKNYQLTQPVCRFVEGRLHDAVKNADNINTIAKTHRIPVCYGGDCGPDLLALAQAHNLDPEEVAGIHCGVKYRVYMIGFMPGFAYLGKVDDRIATPRKLKPQPVKAGSVAIAGEQTGIYPLDSPGGWNIIGRTPLTLFEANAQEPVWINPGDEVEFYSITKEEFTRFSI